jgi:hypothetical protein
MTYLKKIALLCLALAFMSCVLQKDGEPKIKQGIYGTVTWLEGNMMPSPDEPRATNGRPAERQLKIYKVVTANQAVGQAPLFKQVNGELVTTIKTNAKGFYECELPPGLYSVFTVEPGDVLFANSFNGKGQINAVEVLAGKKAKLDIQINYKAAF